MAKKDACIRETDLYPPLKTWLEANGYTVHAEVGGCDVAARKGDSIVLIEMKRAINLDLVLQIVDRQKAADSVYAAVPAPPTSNKRWRSLVRLLRRLEAGLIVVYLDSSLPRAEVVHHPLPAERRRQKTATRALLTEMSGRTLDLNVGGSTRTGIMTAYRERALRTAAALVLRGTSSPRDLRDMGAPSKAGAILLANHYGWFERIAKGLYGLTPSGRAALDRHRELVDTFRFSVNNTGIGEEGKP